MSTKYSTYQGLVAKVARRMDNLINQLENMSKANKKLRTENSQLKMLVETKMRVEGDEYKEFVKAELAKYDPQVTSSA